MPQVGLEENLDNVKAHLQENGYDVVPLNESTINHCDCCVISGQDVNVMGIQDTQTKVPVIDARGLSAEEVLQQVKEATAAR